MIPKPEACKGCPMYGDGKGFVPDEIRDEAQVFVYAQNPGADEEKGRKVISTAGKNAVYEEHDPAPMLGRTGFIMEQDYLTMAGLERSEISLGNGLRCRRNHTDKLPPLRSPEVKLSLLHCHRAHFRLPKACKLIVAQGEYALYALTGETNVSEWRGYLLPFNPWKPDGSRLCPPYTYTPTIYTPTLHLQMPVLAVNHIAAIFRAPSLAQPAKGDWAKIRRILNGAWPSPPPKIFTHQNLMWPPVFAFDTEFIPDTKMLIRYSMAYRDMTNRSMKVHVVEHDDVVRGAPMMLVKPDLVTQNAIADMEFFETIARVSRDRYNLVDIMHKHAVLWAGFPHDLNTFGSLYASINRWKHLEKTNPIVYSGMDAMVTLEVNEHLDREFTRDPQSKKIYDDIQIKLVDVIRDSAQFRGIKVNQKTAVQYWHLYRDKVAALEAQAQAIVGWPINVSSNAQTGQQLYEVEQIQDKVFKRKKEAS